MTGARHSQDGAVTKELAIVLEVRGRRDQGDEHDNVRLGRVIDAAQHSHDWAVLKVLLGIAVRHVDESVQKWLRSEYG